MAGVRQALRVCRRLKGRCEPRGGGLEVWLKGGVWVAGTVGEGGAE